MKVCYVAPDIPVPSTRGASTHVLELSRALAKLGDEVHVVCRRELYQPPEETLSGVTFHRVFRGTLGPLRGVNGYPKAGPHASGLVDNAYSLYLRSFQALSAGLFASHVIRTYGLQVVLERETAFGAGAIASIISNRPMILEIVGPRLSRLSSRVSSRILAYNSRMVPSSALYKTLFVKAAVNLEVFKPDRVAREKVRARLGLEESVVVGYVGTFQPWHGVDDILQAARILLPSNIMLKFLLVGPVPAKIESLDDPELSRSLVLTGEVDYEQVADYVNASDIMVAPYNTLRSSRRTKGIGSPLKVLEYMACGKPTVGSDLPQVSDLIVDGKTGLTYPQGDYTTLANLILELAANPGLRQELGRGALEKAREGFSWITFAEWLNTQFQECVLRNQQMTRGFR